MAAVVAVVVGLAVFALTVTIGDCSAFGGRCPAEGINDDVLGGAVVGAALMGAGAVFALRPLARALRLAAVVAAGAALVGGLLASSMTAT